MIKKILITLTVLLAFNSWARIEMKPEVQKQVQSILKAGDKLHESFFEYDASAVEKAAKDVAQKISELKDPELAKLLKVTKEKLEEIGKEKSESVNKENFYIVSLGLGNVVNKYEVGGKWNIYSCPMVKKKWIQDSSKVSDVQNPYASGMPNCGSKDTDY